MRGFALPRKLNGGASAFEKVLRTSAKGLIAAINYAFGRLYIRQVLTNAQYDREGWKR